jgi:hypothetical protein
MLIDHTVNIGLMFDLPPAFATVLYVEQRAIEPSRIRSNT